MQLMVFSNCPIYNHRYWHWNLWWCKISSWGHLCSFAKLEPCLPGDFGRSNSKSSGYPSSMGGWIEQYVCQHWRSYGSETCPKRTWKSNAESKQKMHFIEFIRCFHQFVSPIFSTNFSQFEQLKKETNYFLSFQVEKEIIINIRLKIS
jgi:hypothetical protein